MGHSKVGFAVFTGLLLISVSFVVSTSTTTAAVPSVPSADNNKTTEKPSPGIPPSRSSNVPGNSLTTKVPSHLTSGTNVTQKTSVLSTTHPSNSNNAQTSKSDKSSSTPVPSTVSTASPSSDNSSSTTLKPKVTSAENKTPSTTAKPSNDSALSTLKPSTTPAAPTKQPSSNRPTQKPTGSVLPTQNHPDMSASTQKAGSTPVSTDKPNNTPVMTQKTSNSVKTTQKSTSTKLTKTSASLNSNKTTSLVPTAQPSTQSPTPKSSTQSPSTEKPAMKSPSTEKPATKSPSTEKPTTKSPSTEKPTTKSPSTEKPTTKSPSTEKPATQSPSTEKPTTKSPSTEKPTTKSPSTGKPATQPPSTGKPATKSPSTEKPATQSPSTEKPVTQSLSTEKPVTQSPSTEKPATQSPSTEKPVTQSQSTEKPATQSPSTEKPVTQSPSTEKPVTQSPSTEKPVTQSPSTEKPVTQSPSTEKPVTQSPSTEKPATQSPSTHKTPQTTSVSPIRHEFVYINEIMLDKTGGFQKVELLLSKKLNVTKYMLVMVDGQTYQTMKRVSLKDMAVEKNGLLLVMTFDASKTLPSMKGKGIGVAIYDTSLITMKADWTVSKTGLVDALVIGKAYNSVSTQLINILTPGVNPFILDPNKYGMKKTISRCSSDQLRSTDMYALINPSFGVDNKQKCEDRLLASSEFAIKIKDINCKLLEDTDKPVPEHQITVKKLIQYLVKKINTECQCGVTRMHIIEPHVHCCDGASVDMKFVAPNKDQLLELQHSYMSFLSTATHVVVQNQLYSIDKNCSKNCCNVPKQPRKPHPLTVDDTAKNVKVTVAVIVSCLIVFMIIVLVVIMYMRRKKSAVYQFRMSRLDEEDEFEVDTPEHEDFVGGQEATFDINSRYQ